MAIPKLVYKHFRVPDLLGVIHPRRGKPGRENTLPYTRGQGWTDSTSKNPRALKPLERGGRTTCTIIDGDGNVLGEGEAVCSYSDNFNYSMGRVISSGRAIASAEDEFMGHFE
jgi:hypothetical protein